MSDDNFYHVKLVFSDLTEEEHIMTFEEYENMCIDWDRKNLKRLFIEVIDHEYKESE